MSNLIIIYYLFVIWNLRPVSIIFTLNYEKKASQISTQIYQKRKSQNSAGGFG